MKTFLVVLLALLTSCSSLLGIEALPGETDPPASSKELTSFSFGTTNPGLAADVVASIEGTSITATVPFATDPTSLAATFSTTGASVTVGDAPQLSGETANDFTNPVTYRVTAADGTTKDFTVTVAIAASSDKDIIAFAFLSANNAAIASDVIGSISGSTIALNVREGAVVTGLKATFSTTGASVKIGASVQSSGVSTNNFAGPIIYRVTAADGTTRDFVVTVTAKSISFAAKTDLTTLDQAASVAAADFNGDGVPDLAVVDQGANAVSVFLDTTTAGATSPTFGTRFDFTTPSDCRSVAIGDFNADGKPDLAIACGSGKVAVFLGTTITGGTTPTFAARADFTTPATVFVAVGDLNSDGKPDLATANINSANVSILLNTTGTGASAPSFATSVEFGAGTNPFGIAVGDLDGDGVADVVTANLNSNNVSVLLNTTAPGATSPTFAAKVDFTTSAGPFTGPIAVAIDDLNGDDKPDLAVANNGAASISVLLNLTATGGVASFAPHADFVVGGFPTAIAIADLDGDGVRDVVVAVNGSSTISVLLDTTASGATTVSLADPKSFPVGSGVQAIAIADFNSDTKLDLATANLNVDTVSVLLNTTP